MFARAFFISVLISTALHSFDCGILRLQAYAQWLDLHAPFRAAQLQAHTVGHISTRIQECAASAARIAGVWAQQWQR